MPLGVLTDKDYEVETNRLGIVHRTINDNNADTSPRALEVDYIEIKHGRGAVNERTEAERAEIAQAAIVGIDVDTIASEFNVSKSSISAYKNGATSTSSYKDPDQELKKANDSVRSTITNSAMSKLTQAIRAIDLSGNLKPNIASAVARDMATIVDKMNPTADVNVNNTKVLIYRPRLKEEDDYDVIQVSE